MYDGIPYNIEEGYQWIEIMKQPEPKSPPPVKLNASILGAAISNDYLEQGEHVDDSAEEK
jgi:hypothetical protein